MSAALEPRETVECTYKDCDLSFPTASLMRRHKKDYHDYCMKCDLDCENPEDYVYHKVLEPDNHLKSCRICGEERHTLSGLKRHIETVSCENGFQDALLTGTESPDQPAAQMPWL